MSEIIDDVDLTGDPAVIAQSGLIHFGMEQHLSIFTDIHYNQFPHLVCSFQNGIAQLDGCLVCKSCELVILLLLKNLFQ
ncbi:hypothetical protein D3C87_1806720 [compost metagenome]